MHIRSSLRMLESFSQKNSTSRFVASNSTRSSIHISAMHSPSLKKLMSIIKIKSTDEQAERVLRRRGGFVGGALMTWAVGNFWNPTGWLAGVGAVVLFSAGAFAGGKAAGTVADEWSKSDQKTLQKHRNDIVSKLKKKLWAQYKRTNDACFDWLSRFETTLLKDIQEPLRQISHAQRQLWRAAVNGLETLDRLEDDLELDVVAKFAELVVPEIASGDIELVRAVRWEGHYTKLLVVPTRPMNNVLGRCIGRGGERVKKLKGLLGGEQVAWVEAGVDFRTQIGQALSPATH